MHNEFSTTSTAHPSLWTGSFDAEAIELLEGIDELARGAGETVVAPDQDRIEPTTTCGFEQPLEPLAVDSLLFLRVAPRQRRGRAIG